MVIDDHCSSVIGCMTSLFPYDSFFLPMFVFSSGYFYKQTGLIDGILHKVKKLYIPYLIWNVVAVIFTLFLDWAFKLNWLDSFSFDSVLATLICYPFSPLNEPSWFIVMLFEVSITYLFLRRLIKSTPVADTVLTVVLTLIGFAVTYRCSHSMPQSITEVCILRMFFYLQFYNLGYMFKRYWETLLNKINGVLVCAVCIGINLILVTLKCPIVITAAAYMTRIHSTFLPLLTAITGIVFYYEVMKFLSGKIGEIKIISIVSKQTLLIMETHMFFLNIPNFIFYVLIKMNVITYSGFDVEAFVDSPWYSLASNSGLISFFSGVALSILSAYLVNKYKEKRMTAKI